MKELKLNRYEKAIILVLSQYPEGLSKIQLKNKILELQLLEMSNEEFEQYNKEVVLKCVN